MKRLTAILAVFFFMISFVDVNAQIIERNEPSEIDRMIRTVEIIQRELLNCKSEMCGTIQEHASLRKNHITRAKRAFEVGDIEVGWRSLQEAKKIIESDIDLLSQARLSSPLDTVLRYEMELNKQVEDFLRQGRL